MDLFRLVFVKFNVFKKVNCLILVGILFVKFVLKLRFSVCKLDIVISFIGILLVSLL